MILRFLLSIVVWLTVSAAALAEQSPFSELVLTSGKVVSATANQIIIEEAGQRLTLEITSKTSLQDTVIHSPEELLPAQEVKISYLKFPNKNQALSIEVLKR